MPHEIIGPGYIYATGAHKISSIVLTRRTPPGWLAGFAIAFGLVMLAFAIRARGKRHGRREIVS